MIDIKWVRENPEEFRKYLDRRSIGQLYEKIIELDKKWRANQRELELQKKEKNSVSTKIANFIKEKKDIDDLKRISSRISEKIKIIEEECNDFKNKLHHELISLPNILDGSVPDGESDKDNIQVKEWGNKRDFLAEAFSPAKHLDIGEKLGLSMSDGTKLSGSRFVVLYDNLAKLERALINFMIDLHTDDHEFKEVSVPFIVLQDCMVGTGQLPKFADDAFAVDDSSWLIPTGEVPLVNLFREKISDRSKFNSPKRYVTVTPCFRKEAGSAGAANQGLTRVHQFKKVEMVSCTLPENSQREHDFLLSCAEKILQLLKLPYRVVILCSGDTGASAKKTYDIEVWLPGENNYREIASCSNCGDYQSRRMDAKYKDIDGSNKYLHTLNSSGIAIGRTIIAILENYQQKDGSVVVPDALVKYTGFSKL